MTTSDVLAAVNALLALSAVIVAAVATKYARDSAVAARETVKPMEDMATGIADSARRLEAVAGGMTAAAAALRHLQDEAGIALQQIRASQVEGRLTHQLHQYERVMLAVEHCSEGLRREGVGHSSDFFQEGLVALRSALSPVATGLLPECRELARPMPASQAQGGNVMRAQAEIDKAASELRDKIGATVPAF